MTSTASPQKRRSSRLLPVLEVLAWIVLTIVAIGSSVAIGLLIDIDCNGLWGDRPDSACMNSKSWMGAIPVGLLALLLAGRMHVRRRAIARRAARGAGR